MANANLRLPSGAVTRTYLWVWQRQEWMSRILRGVLGNRSGTVLDIGANIGQTLLDVLHVDRFRSYVGFEPNPRCVEAVQSVISKNNLSDCKIIPVALWNELDVNFLHSSRRLRIDPSGSLVPSLRPLRARAARPVLCMRFDQIAPAIGVGEIALVKIDVEGSELEVLGGMAGAIKTYRPPILCEVLLRHRRSDETIYAHRLSNLRDIVDDFNYEIFRVVKGRRTPVDLRQVSDFPDGIWKLCEWNQCDYVFLPRGLRCDYGLRIERIGQGR